MSDLDKMTGVKAFLRRTKTTAELEALALATFASATEEVVITSLSTDGTGTSGSISFPKWLLLQAVEEILNEGPTGRQLFDIADRSRYGTCV
jgi:hypothetical protein